MIVIVGLGNPGRQYEQTRHNVGFTTLDLLAQRHGIKVNKIKHKALVGEGSLSGQKVLLVKPQTYMNLSGESIREILAYYKIPAENLMVIYDDVDTPFGGIRIRKQGSAGTHNGMKSIIYQIQDQDFPRIRIGIGAQENMDMASFVLSGFNKDEKGKIEEAITLAADAVETIISSGIDIAMNKYNVKKTKARNMDEETD